MKIKWKTPHCQNSSKIWKLRDQPLHLTHIHDRSLFLAWCITNFYTLCMFYFPLLRIACNNKNNLPKRLDVFSINWNQEKQWYTTVRLYGQVTQISFSMNDFRERKIWMNSQYRDSNVFDKGYYILSKLYYNTCNNNQVYWMFD
jgi:hypothetical protein